MCVPMNYLCGCGLIITVYPQYGLTVINCFISGFGVMKERDCLIGYCATCKDCSSRRREKNRKNLDRSYPLVSSA